MTTSLQANTLTQDFFNIREKF